MKKTAIALLLTVALSSDAADAPVPSFFASLFSVDGNDYEQRVSDDDRALIIKPEDGDFGSIARFEEVVKNARQALDRIKIDTKLLQLQEVRLKKTENRNDSWIYNVVFLKKLKAEHIPNDKTGKTICVMVLPSGRVPAIVRLGKTGSGKMADRSISMFRVALYEAVRVESLTSSGVGMLQFTNMIRTGILQKSAGYRWRYMENKDLAETKGSGSVVQSFVEKPAEDSVGFTRIPTEMHNTTISFGEFTFEALGGATNYFMLVYYPSACRLMTVPATHYEKELLK